MARSKGAGTVVKRGKNYHARRRENGQDQYGPSRTTRKQAEKDLQNWFAPIGGRRHAPLLVDFSIEQLEGAYGKSLARATWVTNSQIHEQFLNGTAAGNLRIDQIDRQVYAAIIGSLVGLQPHRLRRVHAFLSRILSLAVREGLLPFNPATGADLPKTRPTLPDLPDMGALAPVFRSDRPIDLVLAFAYLTGLRRSELVGLLWSDIDRKRSLLHVRKAKTSAGVRVVPLSDAAASVLDRVPRLGLCVFCSPDGNPRSPSGLSILARQRLDQLGIPKTVKPLHGARAAFITALYESGAAPHDAMAIAGHETPAVALRYYAASNNKRLAGLATKASRAIHPDPPSRKRGSKRGSV